MSKTEPLSDEAARKAALKRLRSHKMVVADLMDAVIEAKRLGIEITTIAETAGIARTRVYRILDTAESIQRGLAQSVAGETVHLGDFTQYAAPNTEETPVTIHIPLEEVGALRTRTQALAAEHDRLYRELERLGRVVDHQTTALRDASRKLRAAATVKCWTNEDGKRFVFADDLAEALGYGPTAARTATPAAEKES